MRPDEAMFMFAFGGMIGPLQRRDKQVHGEECNP
jgi:hypothetical protein